MQMPALCCVQVLLGKFSGVVSAAAKAKAWEELARDITGVSGIVRTGQEIHKKWICVKSGAKAVAVEQKKDVKATGGGVSSGVEMSDSQQRILGVIGKVAVEGVAGGFDSAYSVVTPASTLTEVTALTAVSMDAVGVYCISHVLIRLSCSVENINWCDEKLHRSHQL